MDYDDEGIPIPVIEEPLTDDEDADYMDRDDVQAIVAAGAGAAAGAFVPVMRPVNLGRNRIQAIAAGAAAVAGAAVARDVVRYGVRHGAAAAARWARDQAGHLMERARDWGVEVCSRRCLRELRGSTLDGAERGRASGRQASVAAWLLLGWSNRVASHHCRRIPRLN